MIASTCCSSTSVNFSPRPENTLMPLSSNGLWDALITSPASNPNARVMYAVAGVGITPADVMAAPSACTPRPSSRSIHSPDSRVSRPMMNRRGPERSSDEARSARTSAAPSRAIVSWSRGYSPALPRTPSVPKSRCILLDCDQNDGRIDGDDTEACCRIHLNPKIVPAGSQTGKVHECLDAVAAQPGEHRGCAAKRHVDELGR